MQEQEQREPGSAGPYGEQGGLHLTVDAAAVEVRAQAFLCRHRCTRSRVPGALAPWERCLSLCGSSTATTRAATWRAENAPRVAMQAVVQRP